MILPNLKHLQYLVALHQHQHFNRAATACFISQSTLSSAIIKLEEQLGCQLIERDHKAFIFTSQGEKVVEYARQLINNANELVQYTQHQGDPASGTIRIGSIPTVAPYLLTDVVQACREKLPNLALYIVEDTTQNLMAKLGAGEIDLAILALPVKGHNFKTKILGQDAFYIAGEQGLVRQFQSNHDYQQVPEQSVFLLNEEHCLTEHAVSACQLGDQSRIHNFSASSLSTLVQMTAFHQGFTFLPEMAVNKGVGENEGLTVERLGDDVYRDIGMMWRPTSMRQRTFLMLAELVSELLD